MYGKSEAAMERFTCGSAFFSEVPAERVGGNRREEDISTMHVFLCYQIYLSWQFISENIVRELFIGSLFAYHPILHLHQIPHLQVLSCLNSAFKPPVLSYSYPNHHSRCCSPFADTPSEHAHIPLCLGIRLGISLSYPWMYNIYKQ